MGTSALRGAILVAVAMSVADPVWAQSLGALVAPGPLSKAHASLEGVGSCSKCHDSGSQPTGAGCLACHAPIARRIANKTGVHRAVTECGSCHAEHRGADADLRPIDENTFDHAADANYPLEGAHAVVARRCSACHKTRSFLTARAACNSCHADVHKAQLGTDCARCHPVRTRFKETRSTFDHNRTTYLLTGAHRTVDCAKCHAGGRFRELRFDQCSSCHRQPHRRTLGPSCTSCHNTGTWTTRLLDHTRTSFRLDGAHTRLACAKCHPANLTAPLQADRCAACHVNVHRQSVKEDCRACHDERSFRGATFDHRAKTPFALGGRHDGLQCRKCHTTIVTAGLPLARQIVDFGGLKKECVACHEDKHKGEFGRVCDACHGEVKFTVTGFTHPRAAEFFADRHARVTCVKCHVRPPGGTRALASSATAGTASPSMACHTCHTDVHLGQVGDACGRCHGIDAPKFAASRFSHDRLAFPLTGRHQVITCARCHATETRRFPRGVGTAMRLTQVPTACSECHKDPHLGQVQAQCNTCHTAVSFGIFSYKHTGLSAVFDGLHGSVRCQACHTRETGVFPAGRGTTVRFRVPRSCVACHPRF